MTTVTYPQDAPELLVAPAPGAADDELGDLESFDGLDGLGGHVLPPQPDEFQCTSCFLLHHRSRRVAGAADLCTDCV